MPLKIKIYADTANPLAYKNHPLVKGFTTNPSLMYKAGIRNYERFARTCLEEITDRPISFEVFADKPREMLRQARKISSWGQNIYIKIPITDTKGSYNNHIIWELENEGIQTNVTAIMTFEQVQTVLKDLVVATPTILSIFVGRICDTWVRGEVVIRNINNYVKANTENVEVLWASCRESYNIIQAIDANCDIITCTPPILDKLHLVDKPPEEYSLETVQEFYNDAKAAGYEL